MKPTLAMLIGWLTIFRSHVGSTDLIYTLRLMNLSNEASDRIKKLFGKFRDDNQDFDNYTETFWIMQLFFVIYAICLSNILC